MTATNMTACIGWDGPCPIYGQFHGCRYPDGEHPGRVHRCKCGSTTRERKGR